MMQQLLERPAKLPRSPLSRVLRSAARSVSASILFSRARRLHDLNRQNWNLPLSKMDKLLVGSYMILRDFSVGEFPPRFENEAAAYKAEIDYAESLPGLTLAQVKESSMRKPFWMAASFRTYGNNLIRLLEIFEALGLKPGSRLLELGCGAGWMAEFLALAGYSVTGITIAPHEVEVANLRRAAFQARGLNNDLEFRVCPMERADEVLEKAECFQGVFIFEALHHAFDWQKTIHAACRCLAPGGWLVIANEPNLLHTFISYRVGKLSNTHEIGMSQRKLIQEMRKAGFSEVKVFHPRFNNLISHHWIAAKK